MTTPPADRARPSEAMATVLTKRKETIRFLNFDASLCGLRVYPVGLAPSLASSGFDREDGHDFGLSILCLIWVLAIVQPG